METWIIILALVGLLLVSLEVFLPGGILGVTGIVAMVTASVLIGINHGFGYAILSLIVLTGLSFVVILLEMKILGRGPWRRSFFLDASVSGHSQAPEAFPDSDVGKTGITVTALGPTGVVDLGGERREAFSQSGFLDKGVKIQVTGRDNFRLLVRKL